MSKELSSMLITMIYTISSRSINRFMRFKNPKFPFTKGFEKDSRSNNPEDKKVT